MANRDAAQRRTENEALDRARYDVKGFEVPHPGLKLYLRGMIR